MYAPNRANSLRVALLSGLTAVGAVPILSSSSTGILGTSFGIPGEEASFEYVVVGGGNAGLAVAARLAEANFSVAVIEAGTYYELSGGSISEIPARDITYAGKDPDDWQPYADWGFVTAPQEILNDSAIHYPRGRMLGGCSARNFLTYHLATRGSYQMIADLVDDESYTYDNWLPYFQRSQRFTPPEGTRFANSTPSYDESVLGTSGPLSLIFPKYASPLGSWLDLGLRAIGLRPQNGMQNGHLNGTSYSLATIREEENIRDSSETAFLQPLIGGLNASITVYPLTLAKRVLFDGSNATGVVVDTAGRQYRLHATRELILSAGAFQSPQLLMVSGVGPSEMLQRHNIPVVHDSPGVGQNLRDHVVFGISYQVNVLTGSSMENPAFREQAEREYHESGSGPLTSPNVDMFGWEKISRASGNRSVPLSNATRQALAVFPEDWPELEYISMNGYLGDGYNLANGPHDGNDYATVVAGLVATLSAGSIAITSNDTADAPIIDPRFLTSPADREVAIAAFRRIRAIWATAPMQRLAIGEEAYPGLEAVPNEDEDAIWRFIQTAYGTIFHAACTCKMGMEDDALAVLDSRARVRGVDRLRVVDASSLPVLPPGHPMATICECSLVLPTPDTLSLLWRSATC